MSALEALATETGMLVRYHDGLGVERRVPDGSLLALLRARGLPIADAGDADELRARRRAERADRPLPPVVVSWDGQAVSVPVGLEPGTRWRARLDVDDGRVPQDGRALEWESAGHERDRLTLPSELPVGRHRLTLEHGEGRHRAHVLSAPTRTHPGPLSEHAREWGAFLPLYAAWSDHSWGVGDLGDLDRLGRWAHDLGGRVVGTLPLLAAFLDRPCEPSPYAPVSRRFWNELHLDLGLIEPALWSVEARALADAAAPEIERLRQGELVDQCAAMRAKRPVLESIAAGLDDAPDLVRDRFERFVREHPELRDYALFRAVGERHGAHWRDWPTPLCDGVLGPDDADPRAHRYHEVVQWLAHEQLDQLAERFDERGQGLYLDLPLGAHPDGYDVWRHRDLFAVGAGAGAPPDDFFPGGQTWGFPPVDPWRGSLDGWGHLLDCLDHHLRVAGLLRLDHVMSLHRLFWVPDGAPATDGAYVLYPREELAAVVSLASHRWGSAIVGEDLGTVPDEVRELLDRHAIRGMHVMEFATTGDPGDPVQAPDDGSVASFSTHDLPSLAGWWAGADIRTRRELGMLDEAGEAAALEERRGGRRALCRLAGLDPDASQTEAGEPPPEILHAILVWLGHSDAGVVLVDLEELWDETEPQNVPGTTTERPNWRRRARYSLEQLAGLPEVEALLHELSEARWRARAVPALGR